MVELAYKFRLWSKTEENHRELNDLANRRSLRTNTEIKGKTDKSRGVYY